MQGPVVWSIVGTLGIGIAALVAIVRMRGSRRRTADPEVPRNANASDWSTMV